MSDGVRGEQPRRRKTPEQQARSNELNRNRYATDPVWREHMRERARNYYRANKKPYIERAARRRALKASPEEQREVRWRYAMRDHVASLVGFPIVVDHRYPVKLGGGHAARNLGWGTARWNAAKRDRAMHDLPPSLLTHVLVTVPGPDGQPREECVYIHPTEQTP